MIYSRSHEIEKILNNIRVEPKIGLGEFIGFFIRLLTKKSNYFYLILSSIRNWWFPRTYKISFFTPNNTIENKSGIKILIATVNLTERLVCFFKGICLYSEFNIHITTSPKILNNSFVLSEEVLVPKINVPKEYIREIWKLNSLTLFEKLICISALSIQWPFFMFWKNKLLNQKYQLVLFDFDRYPTNVPIVLAARSIGITSVSLVHGSINPISNYIPVLANHLFVWGEFQAQRFSKLNSTDINIHIVGNPKIKNNKGKIKNELKVVGLGTTRNNDSQRATLIKLFIDGTEDFCKRVIKIHPLENEQDYFNLIWQKDNINILGSKYSPDDFLSQIDVLCIRRSQLGSDALGYNIPIIVLDGIDSADLQNGELLSKYAGCPIVQNKFELQSELNLLKSDLKYRQERLIKQKEFFNLLYAYTERESEVKMIQAIKTLNQ